MNIEFGYALWAIVLVLLAFGTYTFVRSRRNGTTMLQAAHETVSPVTSMLAFSRQPRHWQVERTNGNAAIDRMRSGKCVQPRLRRRKKNWNG